MKTTGLVLGLFAVLLAGCRSSGETQGPSDANDSSWVLPPSADEILRTVGFEPSGGAPLLLRARVASAKVEWLLLWWQTDAVNQDGLLRLRAYSSRGDEVASLDASIDAKVLNEFLAGKIPVSLSGAQGTVLDMRAEQPLAVRDLRGEKSINLRARFDSRGESLLGAVEANLSLDVRVMSLNALNLWDDNPSNTAEENLFGYDAFRPEFSNWYDPTIQAAKAANLARTLRIGGVPDVVALQEIESANNKSEVFREGTPLRRELEALGYRYFSLGEADPLRPVAITTAVISRLPLVDKPPIMFDLSSAAFATLSDEEKKKVGHSGRNVQQVEIQAGSVPVRIINNHWRSRGCNDDDSCEMSDKVRMATATVVAQEVEKVKGDNARTDVIVLGDMNADIADEAVLALGSSANRSEFEAGPVSNKLYNLWNEVPPSEHWERKFAGKNVVLSQMLLSDALFDRRGLSLASGSFEVVGHGPGARDVLLNADGDSFRWQELRERLERLPPALQGPMRKKLTERGCFGENAGRHRCKTSYTTFLGKGFSDHLPIATTFHVWGRGIPGRVVGVEKIQTHTFFSEGEPAACDASERGRSAIPDVRTLDLDDEKNLLRCVRLDFGKHPARIRTKGIYDSGYVEVGKKELGIGMIGAYDPRPVVNGVVQVRNDTDRGMSPLSNMCFARKVLQKSGGNVVRAVGRLGYDNGMLSILVAKREDILLSDLPSEKQASCQ